MKTIVKRINYSNQVVTRDEFNSVKHARVFAISSCKSYDDDYKCSGGRARWYRFELWTNGQLRDTIQPRCPA